MIVLNIDDNNKILSAGKYKTPPENAIIIDELPDDDITTYDYVDGKLVKNAERQAELDLKIAEQEEQAVLDAIVPDPNLTLEERIEQLELLELKREGIIIETE